MGSSQTHRPIEGAVRRCHDQDWPDALRIINAAAEAYRGTIPADCWHDPYMSNEELASELKDGVVFSGYDTREGLAGVMGVQRRRNVDLLRRAYVLPAFQGNGIGSALMAPVRRERERPLLVGTWRAAVWAIRFYERHGFARVPEDDVAPLLRAYWTVSDRQIDTSIVLAAPALERGHAAILIAASRDG